MLKRIKVLLRDLKPNPYKKNIQGGYIDPVVVECIKESASKTSFWEQWVVRENSKSQYELAFGHHRLEAAKQLLGTEYEVSVQVEKYTDEQMLIALADENAGSEESVEAQVDVVRIARDYLRQHPETCKVISVDSQPKLKNDTNPKGAGRPHGHGSVECLLMFLGDKNWNHQKIVTLVSIADRFDASLLKDVAAVGTHPERQAPIGITAAGEIARLEKPAQRVVVEAIKEANTDLNQFQKEELRERSKKSLPASGIKDMTTHIPASVVKAAVRKAESLPPSKQAKAVTQHIRHEVERRKDFAVTSSVPHAETVVSKMVAQLFNIPRHDEMEELLAGRDYISDIAKKSLLTALTKTITRLENYRDTLASPVPKKLRA